MNWESKLKIRNRLIKAENLKGWGMPPTLRILTENREQKYFIFTINSVVHNIIKI